MKFLALLVGLTLVCGACGPSLREKALASTYLALDAGSKAFGVYDKQHQIDIAQHASSRDDGLAQLSAYWQTSDKIRDGFVAAALALSAAYATNSDATLSGALSAAAVVAQELAALGVKVAAP